MTQGKRVQASELPDGTGHQVSYEAGTSRKVHSFPCNAAESETPPHGAGSFHDPAQHHQLMDRVAAFLKRGSK